MLLDRLINFIAEQIAMRIYLLFLVCVILVFGMIMPTTTFLSLVTKMREMADNLDRC